MILTRYSPRFTFSVLSVATADFSLIEEWFVQDTKRMHPAKANMPAVINSFRILVAFIFQARYSRLMLRSMPG
jgi:hypothetical protein